MEPTMLSQSDHDLLIRVDENLRNLTKHLIEQRQTDVIQQKDFETRLRFLEKYAWGAIGILGLVEFITSVIK